MRSASGAREALRKRIPRPSKARTQASSTQAATRRDAETLGFRPIIDRFADVVRGTLTEPAVLGSTSCASVFVAEPFWPLLNCASLPWTVKLSDGLKFSSRTEELPSIPEACTAGSRTSVYDAPPPVDWPVWAPMLATYLSMAGRLSVPVNRASVPEKEIVGITGGGRHRREDGLASRDDPIGVDVALGSSAVTPGAGLAIGEMLGRDSRGRTGVGERPEGECRQGDDADDRGSHLARQADHGHDRTTSATVVRGRAEGFRTAR